MPIAAARIASVRKAMTQFKSILSYIKGRKFGTCMRYGLNV